MAGKPTRKELDALDQAQQLMYEAWEASTNKRALTLATKALAISPLCADAYVMLAQHAKPGSEEELSFWTQGVEAGQKALGPAAFKEFEGEFWGWLETRPYMRARHGLASALLQRGRHQEAISHLQDMLRLNPNDNQGLRYMLVGYLAETDHSHEALVKLKESYPEEDMAMWTWPLALAEFRRSGDTRESRAALQTAILSNAHVAGYLVGGKKPPKDLPDYYGIGDDNEAVLYLAEFGRSWVLTPGAIAWVRANSTEPAKKTPRTRYRSKDNH